MTPTAGEPPPSAHGRDIEKRLPSPDGTRLAALEYAGEIRFGPAYFHLWVDGRRSGASRVFDQLIAWHPDSRVLLAIEWLSTIEQRGPHTRLIVIDTQDLRECTLAEEPGQLMRDASFTGDAVQFRRGHGDLESAALPPRETWSALRDFFEP